MLNWLLRHSCLGPNSRKSIQFLNFYLCEENAALLKYLIGICIAGPGLLAPLLLEMLHNIQIEAHRYERLVNYWPVYAVTLEEALCFALRAVAASISCQCGVVQTSNAAGAVGCGGNFTPRYAGLQRLP